MTKDEMRHVAAVLNACADGEMIQYILIDAWKDCHKPDPTRLIERPQEFRIKPKPREWWLCFKEEPSDFRGTPCNAYNVKQHGAAIQFHVREVIDE